MKIQKIVQQTTKPNFGAGITNLYSNFDGTYIPQKYNHDSVCNHSPQINKAEFDNSMKKTWELFWQIKGGGEDAIKNNDVFKIFDAIGDYEVSKVGSDKVSIKNYRQPDYDFSFYDMGIDENKLFSKIVEVRGLLTLENSNLHSLGVCEYVNTLNIEGSSLQNLGNLKRAGFIRNASEGNIKFDFSNIEVEDSILDFTSTYSK